MKDADNKVRNVLQGKDLSQGIILTSISRHVTNHHEPRTGEGQSKDLNHSHLISIPSTGIRCQESVKGIHL